MDEVMVGGDPYGYMLAWELEDSRWLVERGNWDGYTVEFASELPSDAAFGSG